MRWLIYAITVMSVVIGCQGFDHEETSEVRGQQRDSQIADQLDYEHKIYKLAGSAAPSGGNAEAKIAKDSICIATRFGFERQVQTKTPLRKVALARLDSKCKKYHNNYHKYRESDRVIMLEKMENQQSPTLPENSAGWFFTVTVSGNGEVVSLKLGNKKHWVEIKDDLSWRESSSGVWYIPSTQDLEMLLSSIESEMETFWHYHLNTVGELVEELNDEVIQNTFFKWSLSETGN